MLRNLLTLTLAWIGLVVGTNSSADTPSRLNVLFIAVDDLLRDWVGHFDGHPNAKTPNIDRLAERGVPFARTYSAAPQYFENGTVQLFDLVQDIGEQNDLAKSKPEIAEKLGKQLHTWRRSLGAKMPEPNPNFEPGTYPHTSAVR